MKPYKAPIQFAGHIPGDCMADRFRALRGVMAMDVKTFAEFTGLKPDQINKFESNRQFSTQNDPKLDKIARLCGVQPVWLYAGSDAPKRMWPVWWDPTPKAEERSA